MDENPKVNMKKIENNGNQLSTINTLGSPILNPLFPMETKLFIDKIKNYIDKYNHSQKSKTSHNEGELYS